MACCFVEEASSGNAKCVRQSGCYRLCMWKSLATGVASRLEKSTALDKRERYQPRGLKAKRNQRCHRQREQVLDSFPPTGRICTIMPNARLNVGEPVEEGFARCGQPHGWARPLG